MRKHVRLDAALLILVVGFGFSLAANLLWTWPGGVVRILGGALASLALPGAIHLWDKIPLPAPFALPVWRWTLRIPVMRMLRALTMTAIAAMAAYTTFSHASSLLIEHGEEPVLATLYPVMTELLVVMGVLARKTPQPAAPATKRPVTKKIKAQEKKAPADTEQPDEKQRPAVGKRAEGLAWARESWPVSGGAIALAVGVSKAEGDRIRAMVKEEKEQSA